MHRQVTVLLLQVDTLLLVYSATLSNITLRSLAQTVCVVKRVRVDAEIVVFT